jgi:regulator of sigma E protease
MIHSILYFVLAALGLGLLVFIHELGHYFMARHVGMKIEAFGIGFGKPIVSWEHKGVKWNLCWLPFGGYVRIAGMEKKGGIEPYLIPNGFFSKPPKDRIKVAIMGPLVNLVFAFLAFLLLWGLGGREKPFMEHTDIVGWIDSQSKLYELGVRPGDRLVKYDNEPIEGFQDLLYAAVFDRKPTIRLEGVKEDYLAGKHTSFDYQLTTDPHAQAIEKGVTAIGYLRPAAYLIYDRMPDGRELPLPPGSPMEKSGIQYKDRVLWADGKLVFSLAQLSTLVNDSKSLLTVRRGSNIFLTRIPRVQVSDLRIIPAQKAEFDDWQHVTKMDGKSAQMMFIPYDLSSAAVVEKPYPYLDEQAEETAQVKAIPDALVIPLEKGDQILAVDGVPVHSAVEFFTQVQERKIQIIVQRGVELPPVSSTEADEQFYAGIQWNDFNQLINSVGIEGKQRAIGNLAMLNPVVPRAMNDFPLSPERQMRTDQRMAARKKQIEKLENPKDQSAALRLLDERQKRLMLGISLQDRLVDYNPSPVALFWETIDQTGRTIRALVAGYLSPKYLAGPIGMVGAMQYGWSVGFKEALFWMGMISLNLGMINLFPIPVLDGGHICFSLWEWITKKRIKTKTMERWIIPFVVLIVIFFVYVTYQDIMRIVSKFF